MILEQPSIEALRADTPGAERVIHFNNAGSSLPTSAVVTAQTDYLFRESIAGGYETAERLGDAVTAPYATLARLLKVDEDEIGFCGNASDAWRRVLYALPLKPGAHVAFDESIYGGNLLAVLDGRDRFGWRLTPVRLNADSGQMDLEELARVLESGVDLLALTQVPAQSGVVNPIAEIAALARRAGALTLVDACQSLGQLPIDLSGTEVDSLIFTGRKYLRAPRGTGGFVVRRPLLDRIRPLGPDIRGGTVAEDGTRSLRADASVLEQWERNWALHLGLGAALDYLSGLDADWIWQRIQGLASTLVEALSEVPEVIVRRRSAERAGIVVFSLPGKDLVAVRDWLRAHGANTMFAGPQNAPVEMFRIADAGWLRASLHYYNTEDEIARFTELLRTCQRAL
jgi:cysteine desulfurase/selenocysteine lyase